MDNWSLILGLLLVLFWSREWDGYQVGGSRRTGQPCNRINPCSPGLACFYGVCIAPRNSDDEFGS